MLDELVNLYEEILSALNVLIKQKERIVKACRKKVKSKAFYIWCLCLESYSYCG